MALAALPRESRLQHVVLAHLSEENNRPDRAADAARRGLAASGQQPVTQISSTYTLGKGVSAVEGRLYDNLNGKAEFIGKLEDCPALQGRPAPETTGLPPYRNCLPGMAASIAAQ